MPSQLLTNFEIQRHQNEWSNFAYSWNNLSKIKNEAYVIKHEYKAVWAHDIALCVNGNNVTYFHSFGGK